eukprot:ctg_875.g509
MEESLDENALLADWLRALGPLPPGAASRVLWVDADWWLAWQEAWRPQLEPHLRTRLQVASVHCVSDGDADVEDRAGWCWDAARQQVVLVARTFHESVVLQVAQYLCAHGLATPSTSSPPTLLQASPAVHRLVNVPHPCAACWRVLQRAGLGDHFAAPPSSLPLRWRRDALGIDTLCWPSAVRECRLHGRQEWTAQAIAETLMRDPRWRWERVRYVGSWATAVARHMERMRRQRPRRSAMAAAAAAESSSQVNDTLDWRCIGRAEESAAVAPDRAFPVDDPGTARVPLPRRCARRKCARLVLIDRMLDPITPLLTQMTYAGLWSEVARAAYPSWTALGLSPRAIAADDPLLLRIADRNFSEAVRELGHAANRLKRFSEARPNRQTADLQQIAVYVQGLEAHQTEHATVSRHLEAATAARGDGAAQSPHLVGATAGGCHRDGGGGTGSAGILAVGVSAGVVCGRRCGILARPGAVAGGAGVRGGDGGGGRAGAAAGRVAAGGGAAMERATNGGDVRLGARPRRARSIASVRGRGHRRRVCRLHAHHGSVGAAGVGCTAAAVAATAHASQNARAGGQRADHARIDVLEGAAADVVAAAESGAGVVEARPAASLGATRPDRPVPSGAALRRTARHPGMGQGRRRRRDGGIRGDSGRRYLGGGGSAASIT